MHRFPSEQAGAPAEPATAVPVFTDITGQRRRLVKFVGAGGSVLLLGVLLLVGLSLFGGPSTPFSVFGLRSPSPHATGSPGVRHGQHSGRSGANGGTAGPSGSQPSPKPDPSGSRQPSPAPSPTKTSARPTASPSPTTSRSLHSKRPSPSPSPHPHPSHTPRG